MTEDQIERHVARMFDALDARYMKHMITTAEYEAEVKRIDAWATAQLAVRTS